MPPTIFEAFNAHSPIPQGQFCVRSEETTVGELKGATLSFDDAWTLRIREFFCFICCHNLIVTRRARWRRRRPCIPGYKPWHISSVGDIFSRYVPHVLYIRSHLIHFAVVAGQTNAQLQAKIQELEQLQFQRDAAVQIQFLAMRRRMDDTEGGAGAVLIEPLSGLELIARPSAGQLEVSDISLI